MYLVCPYFYTRKGFVRYLLAGGRNNVVRRLFWLVLLLVTGLYSLYTIFCNFKQYFVDRPTSIVTETEIKPFLNMLNVYVCLNSQHSKDCAYACTTWQWVKSIISKIRNQKWRMRKFYPKYRNLPIYMSVFYGNFFNIPKKNYNLAYFDPINLQNFLNSTAPELVILRVIFVFLCLKNDKID